MSAGAHVLTLDFGWGHLRHHDSECAECDGNGTVEDEDECWRCDGDGKHFWGSFYANDRGECEYCELRDVPIACMYEGGDGREWTCLPCYLKHHRESCGCDLWRAAESAAQAPSATFKEEPEI